MYAANQQTFTVLFLGVNCIAQGSIVLFQYGHLFVNRLNCFGILSMLYCAGIVLFLFDIVQDTRLQDVF